MLSLCCVARTILVLTLRQIKSTFICLGLLLPVELSIERKTRQQFRGVRAVASKVDSERVHVCAVVNDERSVPLHDRKQT